MQEKEYSIKEVQNKVLEVMKYVDKVCRENNLNYFLGCGTLIGAIRHKGFIPWDDDADLLMPRPDFDKLIEIMDKDKDSDYAIGSLNNDPTWVQAHARVWDKRTSAGQPQLKYCTVRGIFVDIFPMDGMPDDDKAIMRNVKLNKLDNALRTSANHKYFLPAERYVKLKKLLRPIGSIFGVRWFAQRADKRAHKYKYGETPYVGVAIEDKVKRAVQEKNSLAAFADKIEWPFEDTKFYVPVGYDEVLSHYYGDYMTLPPEDKRKSTHMFKIYNIGE